MSRFAGADVANLLTLSLALVAKLHQHFGQAEQTILPTIMKIRAFILGALVGLSSTIAMAQLTPLTPALDQQLQDALRSGSEAEINLIVTQNSQSSVVIAQKIADAAKSVADTDPSRAAQLALLATNIVSAQALLTTAFQNPVLARALGDVAVSAASIMANERVRVAKNTDRVLESRLDTMGANATVVVTHRAVFSANPRAQGQVTNYIVSSFLARSGEERLRANFGTMRGASVDVGLNGSVN